MGMKTKLAGLSGGGPKLYIEDVFSTYLYTGNGSTQTINNGIDLAGKGGLVWCKSRSGTSATRYHSLNDTLRGTGSSLASNAADAAAVNPSNGMAAFLSNGFTANVDPDTNAASTNFASWTFRKAAKFFDVVTYTGNGSARTIAHSLGSVPACIIIKRTDEIAPWEVWHVGCTSPNSNWWRNFGNLNSTSAFADWGDNNGLSSEPTSSTFSLGSGLAPINASGGSYVAYLFAHNAGGFGANGTDNVISCGSFTTDASGGGSVSLGWEPQFVIVKNATSAEYWRMYDSMRGMTVPLTNNTGVELTANTSSAESTSNTNRVIPNATGFTCATGAYTASQNIIYIAIRRPMKMPTSGAEVFSPSISASGSGKTTTGFPVDMQIQDYRPGSAGFAAIIDRLRGSLSSTPTANNAAALVTNSTAAENTSTIGTQGFDNTGYVPLLNNPIYWNFKRATGFMDVVCYTGTGANATIAHNLGVVPELMIVKERTFTSGTFSQNWVVYAPNLPNDNNVLILNADHSWYNVGTTIWNGSPTSTTFGVAAPINQSTKTMVAYLFATCAGVSKVGSYTGNGSSQNIDCGFAAGARFVLVKRTDSTGDWFVWDTARGIVAANDPHLSLNTTAAEVTTDDSIDPYSAGFTVNQVAATNINVNGASYIYLSVA